MSNINQISPDGGTTLYDIEDTTARKYKAEADSIAPVELDATGASQAYAVDEQFYLVNVLMTATSPISQNDAIVVYPTSGYNCKLSDSVTEQIQAVKDGLGTASAKNSTSVVTDSSDLVESGAVKDIVGWGNKNKLPMTVAGIKALNTRGTWSGNAYTLNGVTFTIQTDADENVTGIKVTGTASAQTVFTAGRYTPTSAVTVKFNGISGTGSSSTYSINMKIGTSYAGDVYSGDSTTHNISANTNVDFLCVIYNGYACPSGGLMFYPMIRLSTVTDATYEPYHASVNDTIPQVVSDAVGWTVGNRNPDNNSHTIVNSSATARSYEQALVGKFVKGEHYRITLTLSDISGFNTTGNMRLRILEPVTFVAICTTLTLPDSNGNYVYDIVAENSVLSAFLQLYIRSAETGASATVTISNLVIEHLTVDEQKCDNSVIAPVENGTTASQAYAVGSHSIRNGAFITWKNAKAQGETINDASDYTSGDVANSLIYTVDYTIPNLSALTWNAPTSSQLSYARIATGSVLPSNAKLIGAVICEPWNSLINITPIIAIAGDNLNINLIIKQSDTPGGVQLTIRLTYILI